MPLNRLLPLLTPLLILALFEIFFFRPKMVYVVLVLVNLLIFFTVWQFTKASEIDKKWWNFFILPSLFATSITAYSALLVNKTVIQLLFFLNLFLLYFYLRNTYYYLIKPALYRELSFETTSSYSNFLIIFLASSFIYGLQSFLNTPVWLLMIIIIFIIGLVVYQVFWANKIELRSGIIYLFIICFILFEVAWSISFLPLHHNLLGLILAICYYMLMGLVRHYLLHKLNKQLVKTYLGLGLVSLIIILITARWL